MNEETRKKLEKIVWTTTPKRHRSICRGKKCVYFKEEGKEDDKRFDKPLKSAGSIVGVVCLSELSDEEIIAEAVNIKVIAYNKRMQHTFATKDDIDFDKFFGSYIATALQFGYVWNEENLIKDLKGFSASAFATETVQKLKSMCQGLLYGNLDLIQKAVHEDEITIEQVGHDFALTQHKGEAEFLNGDYSWTGEELNEVAKAYYWCTKHDITPLHLKEGIIYLGRP